MPCTHDPSATVTPAAAKGPKFPVLPVLIWIGPILGLSLALLLGGDGCTSIKAPGFEIQVSCSSDARKDVSPTPPEELGLADGGTPSTGFEAPDQPYR